ncbi:MAG: hypothetical protein ACFB02_07975 [Mastigocoleus sp.]
MAILLLTIGYLILRLRGFRFFHPGDLPCSFGGLAGVEMWTKIPGTAWATLRGVNFVVVFCLGASLSL